MNKYTETLETVALAALHMGGLSLPNALWLKQKYGSFIAVYHKPDAMQALLNKGTLKRTVPLDNASAALKEARKKGYEYIPVKELVVGMGLANRTDGALTPGLFVATPDKTFYKNIEKRSKKSFTGTQSMTPYGKEMTRRIIAGLNPETDMVVAGFALGIQQEALKTALDRGIPVVAVMATGPDTVYPIIMCDLCERIRETPGCAVITPYFPGTMPMAMNFLLRNHWVAQAPTLYVPETNLHGSAIVTAKLTKDIIGKVYAVPGRVGDRYSSGCNRLIADGIAEILIPEDKQN